MNVIILAGGRGTRLRPLTFAIPKPLIPVGEKPVMELILERLVGFGFQQVFLAVGYRAELLETYFGNGERLGLRLYYHREEIPLGTAGPVRLIRDAFGLVGTCLVLNADIITNVNFMDLIAWHREKDADMTVVARKYEYKMPFGMLEIEKEYIHNVQEKPSLTFNISAGIYLLEQPVLNLIPPNRFYDMPDLMLQLIERGMRLMAYPLTDEWRAIETIDDLEAIYNSS